jgi:hypothetical protein
VREYALFLRLLANRVLGARLSTGARVLDASDFKEWLLGMSKRADEAGTIEEFFSNKLNTTPALPNLVGSFSLTQ